MSEHELQEAFAELVEAAERPGGSVEETLGVEIRRLPDFAGELGDFAAELLLQDALSPSGDQGGKARPPESDIPGDDEAVVGRALGRFRDRLAAEVEATDVPNPFDERPPAELRRLGVALGLDKTLLVKLRDRKIEAESIPPAFVERLAAELGVDFPVVVAHLEAPPIVHRGASFKANGKLRPSRKEGFADAVRRSTLGAEEKARWLGEPEG